jgi:hypothetical protein
MMRILSSLGIPIVLSFCLGCDETLPSRDEPRRALETSAIAVEGTVVIRGGVTDGLIGAFLMKVKNIYSEVLQGDEYIHGDVDVWLRDLQEQRTTVHATRSNLTNPNLVAAGLVTLGPDTTATLLTRWNHNTGGGQPFWNFVRLTPKVTSGGEPYLESDPVHFVATARIQLFKNVQARMIGPFEFTLVYNVF